MTEDQIRQIHQASIDLHNIQKAVERGIIGPMEALDKRIELREHLQIILSGHGEPVLDGPCM